MVPFFWVEAHFDYLTGGVIFVGSRLYSVTDISVVFSLVLHFKNPLKTDCIELCSKFLGGSVFLVPLCYYYCLLSVIILLSV